MATIDKQSVLAYVNALRSTLSDFYTDGVRLAVPTDIQPNGTVAGIFLSDSNDRFQFLINESEARFKLVKAEGKLDSYTVGWLDSGFTLPVQLKSEDAYSAGFLEGWNRLDSRLRKDPTCKVGIACKGGCISRSDECRVRLSSPITQKKVKTILDAGKTIHALGGSDLILPLLGTGAIALVSFSAGVSVGSYLGAEAASKPPQPKPQPVAVAQPPVKEYPMEPDPWADPPVKKKRQPKQQPKKPTAKKRPKPPEGFSGWTD